MTALLTKKTIVLDVVSIFISAVLYAAAFVIFIEPAQISPGGVTGVAALIHFLFPWFSTGVIILIINIPLFLIGLKSFGKQFVLKSLFATVSLSFAIDIFGYFLPRYRGDAILSSLFAGVLTGVALSLVMLRGFTTGGIDIIAKLILRSKPFLSFGKILLFIDAVIVLAATLVYRNIETTLYSVVMLFTASKMIDSLLYGADRAKLLLVITDKEKKLTNEIMAVSGRGVTVLPVKGGYTSTDKNIIMTALRIQEVAAVKNIIKSVDSKAFVIISDVGEILGLGFKDI